MVFFRFVALIFIVAALMALGSDVVDYLKSGHFVVRSGGELWEMLHAESASSFLAWAQSTLPAVVYDPGILKTLAFHAWASLGAFGLLLALIFHSPD